MNTTPTELRVIYVNNNRNPKLVVAEVIQSEPRIGMKFKSEEIVGMWEIVGFGVKHNPPNQVNNSIVLTMLNLDPRNDLRSGVNLTEVA